VSYMLSGNKRFAIPEHGLCQMGVSAGLHLIPPPRAYSNVRRVEFPSQDLAHKNGKIPKGLGVAYTAFSHRGLESSFVTWPHALPNAGHGAPVLCHQDAVTLMKLYADKK
jgi:hypothetical protein